MHIFTIVDMDSKGHVTHIRGQLSDLIFDLAS